MDFLCADRIFRLPGEGSGKAVREDRHFGGHVSNLLRFFQSEIAVSDDCHFFAPVEKGIADCTVAHASAFQLLKAPNHRSFPAGACCQNHCLCVKIALVGVNREGIEAFHAHDLGREDADAKSLGLINASIVELLARQGSASVIIFNFFGLLEASGPVLDDQRVSAGAGSIKGRGNTCWAAAYDNDIFHWIVLV